MVMISQNELSGGTSSRYCRPFGSGGQFSFQFSVFSFQFSVFSFQLFSYLVIWLFGYLVFGRVKNASVDFSVGLRCPLSSFKSPLCGPRPPVAEIGS